MTNIKKFPKKIHSTNPLPRRRVFYIGYRYVGSALCQELEDVYLKRKGKVHGNRKWSIITYVKCEESGREYSFEEAECYQDAVPDMIGSIGLEEEVTLEQLRDMGWSESANVIDFVKTKP